MKHLPARGEHIRLYELLEDNTEGYLFEDYHLNSAMAGIDCCFEQVSSKEVDWRQEKINSWRRGAHSVFGALNSESNYPAVDVIELPKEFSKTNKTFEDIIKNRRSLRDTKKYEMSFEELAYVLLNSLSITYKGYVENRNGQKVEVTFRAYPSGGGLYPIETYVIPMNVNSLEMGVYHYNPFQHTLEKLGRKIASTDLAEIFMNEKHILDSSVFFIHSAKFLRSSWKYGERSYRFVLIETGAILHNISLCAEAIGLRGVMIGGFYDNLINQLLGCNGLDEGVILAGAIGKGGENEIKSNT